MCGGVDHKFYKREKLNGENIKISSSLRLALYCLSQHIQRKWQMRGTKQERIC